MLVSRVEPSLRFLGRFYRFMYEVPVRWSKENWKLYTSPKRKWILYYVSMSIVTSLWLTCVYTLPTQLFLHRKTFGIVQACILTTGFGAFTVTMAVGNAICDRSVESKIFAVNQYLHIESALYTKYKPNTGGSKPLDSLDIILFIIQLGNFIPFLILFACLYWDLDGPYWVIEDFAPSAMYREPRTILAFLVVRALLLMVGFWETTRTITGSAMIMFTAIDSMTFFVKTLTYKVKSVKIFFRYYTHVSILCNALEGSSTLSFFLTITTGYYLWILWIWVCVNGFGKLELPLYFLFLLATFIVGMAVLIYLPKVAVMGEAITKMPNMKRIEMRKKYTAWKSIENKIAVKKSNAIRPFRFQYGSFYPMGSNFSRNTFGNMIENAITVILLFDIDKQ
ncbi:unnamed protein product [Orchesella dallaii]|uniref:Gustatory receptor n=1 Tax=Orchesella dallaii TaxID=48710 RepID=A0ABP1RSG2_9HEXA